MKRILTLFLACMLLLGAAAPALADGEGNEENKMTSVVIIGGDLNVSQKADVYSRFGIKEGDVRELIMTFAEEKAYMEGRVPADKLGSRSISSAYINMAKEGSGISVRTYNITWVTAEMYISALSTAGVEDADIIVAAPFGVSGTAALAGIFKAYETMTGEKLDEAAKDVAGDELIVTGELGDVIGSEEAMQLIQELKKILAEIKNMTDEELRQTIIQVAEQYNISLTEEQITEIQQLMRKMADLDIDPEALLKQAQNAQKAFEDLAKAGEKTAGFFASVANFFNNIGNWFKKLFGIKD